MKRYILIGFVILLGLTAANARVHRVPWEQMNELFGIELWQDTNLWDDSAAEAAKRLQLKLESRTGFMENHRAYPLGRKSILSEPAYTVALYGSDGNVDSLSIVFLNQGDIPVPDGIISPGTIKAMAEKIKTAGERVENQLVPILGKPKRDALGKGALREKAWRWDWNGHALLLTMQEGKYAALRIMPTARADRAGRVEKIKEADLKKRMKSCVEKRGNGDVVINNIPMINQGPKGYCSPATWERYLRYMDIPADMYLLALAANTGVGGGTYSDQMIEATRQLVSANGRELEKVRISMAVEEIAEYIDDGLPLMWHLLSTPGFQNEAQANTQKRRGRSPKPAGKKKKKKRQQAEFTGEGGHVCLIVGYNAATGEIAISDSWGPQFAERWVHVSDARKVSRGNLYVIKW